MPPLSGPKKPSSSLVGPLRRSPLRQDGWRLFGSRRLSRWDPLASRTGNGKKKISHIRLTPRSPVTREIERRTLALALLLLPSLRGVAAPAGARREDRRRGWSPPPPPAQNRSDRFHFTPISASDSGLLVPPLELAGMVGLGVSRGRGD